MKYRIKYLIFLLMIPLAVFGRTIYIPEDYPTIQEGINASAIGDTVLVADGTYTGTRNKNIDFLAKAIVLASENGSDNCIIDCENDGRGFYFHLDENQNSILTGFQVTNGIADNGGGIICDDSSPRISNCIFTGCFAGGGGGIYCDNASPVFIDCVISGNSADYLGGGIALYGNSNPTFLHCNIIENSTPGYSYGGGGIYCGSSAATIINCNISENYTEDEGGGGIFIDEDSQVDISFCVINRNSASQYGGGIYCFKSNSIINHCLIEGNTAYRGGGIFCHAWQASSPSIINCTITRNSADNSGGGLYYADAEANIINSIVEGNINGGIHFCGGQHTVAYCDFNNNEGGDFTGYIPQGLGEILSVNTNGDSCDTFFNILLNPLFVDPFIGDFHLLENSPCIDAGDPTSPYDPDSTIVDIGAYYYHQSTRINPESDPNIPFEFGIKIYPNPFNQRTMLDFVLPSAGNVSLTIFDITGRSVGAKNLSPLQNQYLPAGQHSVVFDAEGLTSGVYFARLEAGDFRQTRKILLVK